MSSLCWQVYIAHLSTHIHLYQTVVLVLSRSVQLQVDQNAYEFVEYNCTVDAMKLHRHLYPLCPPHRVCPSHHIHTNTAISTLLLLWVEILLQRNTQLFT